MVKRKQETITFSEDEKERITRVAKDNSESFSGFIRRQIMIIVKEEESQK